MNFGWWRRLDGLVLPALDIARDATERAVHVLDCVGGSEAATQRPGQAEAHDGERFVEALAQARGSVVVSVGVQPRDELQELFWAVVAVAES